MKKIVKTSLSSDECKSRFQPYLFEALSDEKTVYKAMWKKDTFVIFSKVRKYQELSLDIPIYRVTKINIRNAESDQHKSEVKIRFQLSAAFRAGRAIVALLFFLFFCFVFSISDFNDFMLVLVFTLFFAVFEYLASSTRVKSDNIKVILQNIDRILDIQCTQGISFAPYHHREY